MNKLSAFFVLAVLAVCVAHSWIDCTDYTEKNGKYYSAAKCRARPRKWENHAGGGVFGADTGYNHQDSACKYALAAGTDATSFYTSAYPMAVYRPGQEVCLAWPSKNHVAASCTNPYIPDTSNEIFMSAANPTADPTGAGWVKVADFGANKAGTSLENGGGKGFQNCPAFCENMDKSLCTQCFIIPANTAPGRYVFQWRWVFNAGTPAYTSCWDATISNTGTPTQPTQPNPNTPSNPDPVQDPLVGNAIRIANPPNGVAPGATSFVVQVQYSALETVDIVVDFLKPPTYSWFGKGIKTNVPKGSGTLELEVKVQNNPENGQYVIKPWIVPAGKGEVENGWTYELDRKEYPTEYGKVPTNTNSASKLSFASALLLVAVSALYLLF